MNAEEEKLSDELASINSGEMAITIMQSILNSPLHLMKYCPDAMMRIFVYLSKKNGWSLEQMQKESSLAIKYYYENERQ